MIDFLLGLLIVVFGSITIWLLRARASEERGYDFDTSLFPYQIVSNFREQQTSPLSQFYKSLKRWLIGLLPLVILVGGSIVIVVALYTVFKSSTIDSLPIVLIGVSNLLLVLAVIWLLFTRGGLSQP